MRERYGDDILTHPDFDSNLLMEVGWNPKKSVVRALLHYDRKLSAACSVSTVGSSQSVSSTQSKEFVALQQHMTHLTEQYEQLLVNYEQNIAHTAHLIEKYEQLLTNYEQLHQMVMNMTSQSGDTCALFFLPYGTRNNQAPHSPPPALPLC